MTDFTDRLIKNPLQGNVQQAPLPAQVQMPMLAFAEQLVTVHEWHH